MEKLMKLFIVVFTLFVFTQQLRAQDIPIHEDPKYGVDSAARMECVKNTSVYRTEMKQSGVTPNVVKHWRKVYTSCPQSSKNVYIDGIKIVQHLVDENKANKEVQLKYVDTLMMVYDSRIKYFGDDETLPEGRLWGLKGLDMFKYAKDVVKANEYFGKSIEIQGKKTDDFVLVFYMQTTMYKYKYKKIEMKDVVESFSKVMEIAEYNYKNASSDKMKDKWEKSMANIEKFFLDCEPKCEDLIPFFKPKFEAAPDDIELLKKIITNLDKAKCVESEFYAKVSEQLYLKEPSGESANNLGNLFYKKKEYEKATKYFNEAGESTDLDSTERASIYYKLAVIEHTNGNKSQARTYARTASKFNPNWGKPYILIGDLYMSSSCGENAVEKAGVYWVAEDKYIKARSVDEEVAEEAGQKIGSCRARYPNKEDAFFYGHTEGKSFTVGCWINETTTVRLKN